MSIKSSNKLKETDRQADGKNNNLPAVCVVLSETTGKKWKDNWIEIVYKILLIKINIILV